MSTGKIVIVESVTWYLRPSASRGKAVEIGSLTIIIDGYS